MKITLEAARRNAGLTQEDVAQLSGFSSKIISKWERGENAPNVKKAEILCNIYNVPMGAIKW